MSKQILVWVLAVVLLFSLQSSFFPMLHYNGIGPDLLLLFTASYAFLKGSQKGSFMGFMVGLFQDMATGGFLGVNTMIKAIIGYGCGILSSRVLQDNFYWTVLSSVIATISSYAMAVGIMLMLGYRFGLVGHMAFNLLIILFYNTVFAYPIHILIHKLLDLNNDKK